MIKQLGVLLYNDVQPIDIIGPWEVFSVWKSMLNAPIDLHLVAEKVSVIRCDSGINMQSHIDFDHCPQLDYLIVPGGRGRFAEMNNKKLLSFIKNQAEHCEHILSVCTGSFLLYQAGILKNESITTYWRALPELLALNNVHVKEERVVKSGKVWAAGGLSSGIDLALELIAEIAGEKTAGQVQLLFEYFPADTLYASPELVDTMPPYYGSTAKPQLPLYVKNYIQSKKNKNHS